MESAVKSGNKNILDLVKFLMAICVVAIHTNPLEHVESKMVLSVYDTVVSLAVPFFFLCSGYLAARKMNGDFNSRENAGIVKKTLMRILKMYLVWSLIYFPLAVYGYRLSGSSVKDSIIDYIKGLVFVGEHYNSYPLWYLLSTVYACLFILIIYKLGGSHKTVVGLGFAVVLIAFATSHLVAFEGNLPKVLDLYASVVRHTTINGRIFFGLFYFPFGMSLGKKEIPLPIAIILFAAGFIGRCIFIDNIFISYIFLLMCSVGFFSLVLRVNLKDSKVFFSLRKSSTIVYLIHMYVWTAFYLLVYHQKEFGAIPFAATAALSIMISYLYIFAVKKQRNKA